MVRLGAKWVASWPRRLIELELPEAINREAMLERVRKIYTRVQHEGMYLPGHVKTRLAQILKELTRTRPNLEELNPYASPILHWYFDQSGPDDPLQRTIGDLALDIVKIFDIEKILAEVQSLRVQPGHPDFLGEISDLLKSLRTAFHPDGRIDPAPYDNLARRLRQLTAPHRPFLEKNIDRAIFHI